MISGIESGGSGFNGHFPEQRTVPVKLGSEKLVINVCCLFLLSILCVGIFGSSNAILVPKSVGDLKPVDELLPPKMAFGSWCKVRLVEAVVREKG